MRTRLWLVAALSSVLVLAACGASQGRTSQGGTQGATAPASAGQTPVNPCVPSSCGAGLNATSTTSQANGPGARSSSLEAWGAAYLASLQTLSSEATHLLAGAGDADQVKLACSQLGSQAQAALSSPPPPDAATAARLHSGLTQLGQLSRDCATAFATGDATAASRLIYEANQATAAINEVIQAVESAGHPAP